MPREHSTKYLLSKFLHFGVLLMNQKHIPLGIIVKDKKKTFAFGSNNIKEYLQDRISDDEAVKDGFKTDQDDLNLATDYDYYPVDPKNAYSSLIAGLGPSLLPYPVDFMNHEELCQWLIAEIWQDAVRRGFQTKTGQVTFKNPRYKPIWWLEEIWPWGNTRHLTKVTKIIWARLGLDYDFVTFMKKCVRACLEHHDINPEDHVNPNHNREKLKKRKNHRGIPTSPPRSSSESSQDSTVQSDDIPLVQPDVHQQQGSFSSETSRDISVQTEDVQAGQNDDDSDESETRGRFVRRRPGPDPDTSSSIDSRPATPSIINAQQISPPSSINIAEPSPSSSAGVLPRQSSSAPSSQSLLRSSSSSSSSSAGSLPSLPSSSSPSPPSSSPSPSPPPVSARGRRKTPEEFNRRGPRPPPPAKPPSRRRRNAP